MSNEEQEEKDLSPEVERRGKRKASPLSSIRKGEIAKRSFCYEMHLIMTTPGYVTMSQAASIVYGEIECMVEQKNDEDAQEEGAEKGVNGIQEYINFCRGDDDLVTFWVDKTLVDSFEDSDEFMEQLDERLNDNGSGGWRGFASCDEGEDLPDDMPFQLLLIKEQEK
jgi:hypothetical protein